MRTQALRHARMRERQQAIESAARSNDVAADQADSRWLRQKFETRARQFEQFAQAVQIELA
jgi:hypothetical protein